jgi:hypothetical protein
MAGIRTTLTRISSAHAIAFAALCVALGGGLAIAAKQNEPKPTVGYHHSSDGQVTQPSGRENLVSQLVVPAKGFYSVTAKLEVAKATGNEFTDGAVTCRLGAIGEGDASSVTLRKGDIATLSLQAMGGKATGEGDQAFDLSCNGFDSSYVISGVRMSAIRLDKAKLQ